MTAPTCDRAWGDGQPCPADTPSRRRMVPKGPLVDLAAIHHCCIGGAQPVCVGRGYRNRRDAAEKVWGVHQQAQAAAQ